MSALSTPSNAPIRRVLIADDHVVVRKGLRALIEATPGWEICAEATDGNQALALAAQTRPDVIVLDLTMPELNGIDVALQLTEQHPQARVLILTMHESAELAAEAFRAGARGYLVKNEDGDTFMAALEALARGETYLSSSVSGSTVESHLLRDAKRELGPLTARERQVVQLVAEGKINKVIAERLNVGVKTIEAHRSAAMRKIGASCTAQLTLYAIRNHLVEA